MHQNRIARLARNVWPTLQTQRQIFVGIGRDVVLFQMSLDRSITPLLEDPSRRKWLYLFDTWQPDWPNIERVLSRARNLSGLFLASSQSAEYFAGRFSFPVHWMPQAAQAGEFSESARDWSCKRNVVFNIGRTNDELVSFFQAFCSKHGYEFIRERVPGEVCFESRADFIRTLHEASIVVVHPRDLQYPEVTGCVSMLTARNFEAYQSASVVCGFKPGSAEFDRLFPEMPFVEFHDARQFESELLDAVKQPHRWVSASIECENSHTWEHRLVAMKDAINRCLTCPVQAVE